jgi:hypothetical protein
MTQRDIPGEREGKDNEKKSPIMMKGNQQAQYYSFFRIFFP